MATSMYGNMTPFIRHFHVLFDVALCLLKLSNVELCSCNQRCGQRCAGGGRGGTVSFHHGSLDKKNKKWLYQKVRQDRFYKKSTDIISMIVAVSEC